MSTPTLSKEGYFYFDECVKNYPKEINLNDKPINIILGVVEKKLNSLNDFNSHLYFLDAKTASGKSTYFITQLFHKFNLKTIVAQPRVLLATSIPDDITNFDNTFKMGINIGYLTGSYKCIPSSPVSVVYSTTEILRKKINSGNLNYSFCVVDECHITDNPMLTTLKSIKDYLYNNNIPLNQKPIFIFQSATFDVRRYIEYFFNSLKPIEDYKILAHVKGAGSNFKVDDYFLKKEEENNLTMESFCKKMFKIIELAKINKNTINGIPIRDILIFCYGRKFMNSFCLTFDKIIKQNNFTYPILILQPGENDFEKTKSFRQKYKNQFRILVVPYISGIPGTGTEILKYSFDQDVDAQRNEIKIYLSTPAIEVGKTIYSLYIVIDTGLKNSKLINPLTYSPYNRMMLTISPCDKSAIIQRVGRVGRKSEGIRFRMYSKETYDLLKDFPEADNIETVSNAEIILPTLKIGDILDTVRNNDYLIPNTFDTNLRTGQDLITAGFMTPYGKIINNNYVPNWVMYAKYLMVVEKMEPFKAFFLARINRNKLPLLLTPIHVKLNFEKEKENLISIQNALLDARKYYLDYLYNPNFLI